MIAINNATGGFQGLNAKNNPPAVADDMYVVEVIDEDTLQINSLNAVGLKPSQPVTLVIYSPLDISDCVSRAQLRKKVGSPVIHEFLSPTEIVIEPALHSTTVEVAAELSAELAAGTYVMDVEIVFPDDTVKATQVMDLEITPEVTVDG